MTKTLNKKRRKSKIHKVKQLSRKELRNLKKQEKKDIKRIYFSSKTKGTQLAAAAKAIKESSKISPKKIKKKSKPQLTISDQDNHALLNDITPEDDGSINSDFSDVEVDSQIPKSLHQKKNLLPKKTKQQKPIRPDASTMHFKELQKQNKLLADSKKQRVKQLVLENEEEDKMIAKLEKKLKLNKTKDKNRLVRKMFNDGLDYALEFCMDDNNDLDKNPKNKQRVVDEEDEVESDFEKDEDVSISNDGDDDEDQETMSIDENENVNSKSEAKKMKKIEAREDIYGRRLDKNGNIIKEDSTNNSENDPKTATTNKYIPPHMRADLANDTALKSKDDEILQRLRRQCKGLLNRLSEANLSKIATGIEELYMKNSRYNMNDTLFTLLNEALIGRTMTNERMVQEHMVLLAYLHAHVGSEIGAHFLQMFIEKFDGYIKQINTLAVEDKHLNNLILVLAYLYIFKIYEYRLLYEIINLLAQNLCEKTVECLLLIFQSVGFKLRKDDPLAFKQMMLNVQEKIAEVPLDMKENLRLMFMLDILNAVKNNNMNKIPKFDPELAERLRKRLKMMLRNDKYVVTLNISLDDLLRADKVGKWWIVGSAWSGNINDVGAAKPLVQNASSNNGTQRFSEKLLALAKKQKMNTEERRNIFCIVMSAEDYIDAFERILHLALKDQRSIASVILHCCLNEKQCNPYYAHLALKFCNYNRKFQLAFQFASWDRIKEINNLTKQQIKNLAEFLLHLFRHGGLVLSVLKVVDFCNLDKPSFLLMKKIIVGLLLVPDENEARQPFERIAKSVKLNTFKNSIRLFMQHFLLQNDGANLKLREDQLDLLKRRIEHIDTILAYVDL